MGLQCRARGCHVFFFALEGEGGLHRITQQNPSSLPFSRRPIVIAYSTGTGDVGWHTGEGLEDSRYPPPCGRG